MGQASLHMARQICKTDFRAVNYLWLSIWHSNVFLIEHLPSDTLCKVLSVSRRGLASGTYLQGTFEIVRLLMDDKQSMVSQSSHVRQAIFAVLKECKRFFKADDYKNQVQLCADELRDFILAVESARQSLPNHWAEILGRAVNVHNMARAMMPNPTYSNCPRNSIVPSRSSMMVDFPFHGEYSYAAADMTWCLCQRLGIWFSQCCVLLLLLRVVLIFDFTKQACHLFMQDPKSVITLSPTLLLWYQLKQPS